MKNKFLVVWMALIGFLAIGLSGCAPAVNHSAEACSAFSDIRQTWISTAESDSMDTLQGQVAILSGVLAVWKENGADGDPIFTKLSSFAGKMLLFMTDGSPESARDILDFEDKELQNIESLCELPNTYVAPLHIDGGCWNLSGVTAELQSKDTGEWAYEDYEADLAKTEYCSDPDYPWGVEFKVRRSTADDDPRSFRIVWKDADGGTFANGRSTNYSCPVDATRYDEDITIYGSNCDE